MRRLNRRTAKKVPAIVLGQALESHGIQYPLLTQDNGIPGAGVANALSRQQPVIGMVVGHTLRKRDITFQDQRSNQRPPTGRY
jgi:hypothetical protein